MANNKIVGILGSKLIGTDPFSERAWSGSSKFFFEACQRAGILERAFGVEVPIASKLLRMLINYSPDRERWRQKFYLDLGYYRALTKKIEKQLVPEDFSHSLLQLGGIYDIPAIVQGRCKCYSYHDGNLAQFLRSPFFPKGIASKKIDQALEYEQQVYSGMDGIFTMSDYLRRSFIEDFGIESSKVRCIGAGINIDRIPDYIEKSFDNKVILFIGIRFHRKGGNDLLKAFKIVRQELPDATLHIVGPPKLKISGELSEGVNYNGFLSKAIPEEKQRIEDLLRAASLFVMPSLYEPFGIAPLEAMVHQIPCILTNRWAFPEMVQPGINGELVECGNVEELGAKIISLLKDPDLLKRMGNLSRTLVLEKYIWDRVVGNLRREIGETAGRRR